jgi:hypothetical protein
MLQDKIDPAVEYGKRRKGSARLNVQSGSFDPKLRWGQTAAGSSLFFTTRVLLNC